MKSRFYGKEKSRVVKLDMWDLKERLGNFSYQYYLSLESVNRLIESLKEYRDSDTYKYSDSFIYEQEFLLRTPIFMTQKELSYLPNVGEKIELNGKEIKIVDKKYDADEDIMHYYTDEITGIKMERYYQTKKECADIMIKMLEDELPKIEIFENRSRENRSAVKEQEQTFIGKIIKWFKG